MRQIVTFVALLLAAGAQAQTADSRNAATWYLRAVDQYLAIPEAQRDLLADYDPASGPPSPQLRATLNQMQAIFQTMQRGSMQDTSDFALDYSQGFELLLPHLSPMRQIARAACTDAMVRISEGDSSGAADRLASLYRMSGHGGDDRILISCLVGQAVFSAADRTVQYGIDRAVFNAGDSAKLFSATQSLNGDDPFQYLESVATEQEVAVDWITRRFEEAESPEQFAQTIAGGLGEPSAQALAGLDQEGFDAAIGQYDAVMTRVVEAFANPDPQAAQQAIDQIQEEMMRGEHGPIAAMMVPSFSKLMERRSAGEKMLAERIAVLEGLVKGEVTPEEIANAAMWYLRGIELLESVEETKLESVRAAAMDSSKSVPTDVIALLDSKPIADAIEQFREGSTKRRCDFNAMTRRAQMSLIAPYGPGMNDGLILLRLDAQRRCATGGTDGKAAALDRLATLFRVIGHVSGDPMLICSIISHTNFNAAQPLLKAALDSGDRTDADKAALLDAMDRISRRDPFGYVEAVVQSRKTLAHKVFEEYDGDDLLRVALVFDLLAGNGDVNLAAQQAQARSRLAPVFSTQAIESMRLRLSEIAPMIAANDWSIFLTGEWPAIVEPSVRDRMRRARADLRSAAGLLRPEVHAPAD
jgi:hypothetical protein